MADPESLQIPHIEANSELTIAAVDLLKAIKTAIESGTHKVNIYPLHTTEGSRDEERPAVSVASHSDGTITVELGRTDIEPVINSK